MRANGVPNFPDPSAGGGGFTFQPGSGVDPGSQAFRVAQRSSLNVCATFPEREARILRWFALNPPLAARG
jgi:hypothetical protein